MEKIGGEERSVLGKRQHKNKGAKLNMADGKERQGGWLKFLLGRNYKTDNISIVEPKFQLIFYLHNIYLVPILCQVLWYILYKQW